MLTDKERAEIRRKMMELTEEPPANAWKAIHAEIKPRRRWRFAWWITGAVLLLLTTAGIYFIVDYYNSQEGSVPTASLSQLETEIAVPATAQPAKPNTVAPQASTQSGVSSPFPAHGTEHTPTEIGKETQPLASKAPVKNLPSENVPAATPENIPAENIPGKVKGNLKTTSTAILKDKIKNEPIPQTKENAKERTPHVRPEIVENRQISRPGHILEQPSTEKNPNKQPVEKAAPIDVPGKTPSSTANPVSTAKPGKIAPNETLSKTVLLPGSEEKSANGIPGKPQDTENSKEVSFNRPLITSIPSRSLHANASIYELVLDSIHLALVAKPEVLPVKEHIITPERKPAAKEWTMGVFFSPRYAFRVITPASSDDIYITGLSKTKKSGTDRMGYEAGINLSKTISRNLYLETSLTFMQLKENLSYDYTTGIIDTLLRTVSPDGKEVQVNAVYVTGTRQLISTYAYGGWRMGATYYFWQNHHRRFNFTLNGGVNLLLKGQTREIINGQESRTLYFPSKENILEQTNYNLMAGAGYSVRVMQKYELMLMPTLNYFLGSTFKTREPFGLKPYSLGIHIQLKRRFPL
ncbi:hypothetical protein GXP67_06205 [Rhodocytophaga rosea]|uniref:Uncharacterized protein n=1 Tax=Rhodocytophaga rosea TaxID=2704465 RepID=A0A6C0GEA5_9BACT|nr:hypothetical protein [Rhodocytophaga rosea]QHT66278.1 hypothetical protein GXP67_06205 [Rhodocytophaga rosea]